MKTIKVAAALLACLLVCAQFTPPKAFADSETTDDAVLTVQLKKYFVMEKDDFSPDAAIKFILAPGSAKEATETSQAVFSGPEGAVFIPSEYVDVDGNTAFLNFSHTDVTIPESEAPSGSPIDFRTADDNTDEVYIEKSLALDFSSVTFPDSGIFRYSVTETPCEFAGMVADDSTQRIIDVYTGQSVEHDDPVFVPYAIVVRTSASAPDITGGTPASAKFSGSTNRFAAKSISFSKNVTGNQASYIQYFRFTVKLTGDETPNEDKIFVRVSGTYDPQPAENMATAFDAEDMLKANQTELTEEDEAKYITLDQLRNGKDFYIRNDQSVRLDGIPLGLGYKLTEDNEDYTPQVDFTGDEAELLKNGISDESLNADTDVSFLNSRDGLLPETGIAAGILIPAVVMLTAAVGIILLKSLRRKNENV